MPPCLCSVVCDIEIGPQRVENTQSSWISYSDPDHDLACDAASSSISVMLKEIRVIEATASPCAEVANSTRIDIERLGLYRDLASI